MLLKMKLFRLFSTVDPAETSRFASYDWWSQKNVLHPFSDLRVEFMQTSLKKTRFSGLSLLDVGCGGGIMSERLGRLGGSVLGIDPTSEAISVAQDHLPHSLSSKVRYLNCELDQVPETFDVVLASEVIEHVVDPERFLTDAASRVKENGSLFITTVNRTPEAWLLGIILSEYVLRIVEPGTHQWEKFIAPEEVARIGKKAGLHMQSCKGWFLDYFRFKAFFTDCDRLGYLMHFTKTG
jgi:polyprenyldihydroxybenzoate methyltransferase / 3-demethylubiquinol 3-O-methyltransferase